MLPTWEMIDAILTGAVAVRAAGEKYLPRYEGEDVKEYNRRLKVAPWRPEFADSLLGIVSKPFGKEVALQGEPPARIRSIAEDVDGRGNNLHVFAAEVFRKGVAKGMHAILVDYPTDAPNRTRAEELSSGARPYWVHVQAEDILALYTEFVAGRDVVKHVRIREVTVEREEGGYGEETVERVRVLEPGRWELWRKTKNATTGIDEYTSEAVGTTTLQVVPLVPYFTGERIGDAEVRPPLHDLAEMQMELYRALSRQDEILTFAGSPMLCGEGVMAPMQVEGMAAPPPVTIGPKRVLYSGQTGTGAPARWLYVQPDAANIEEVRNHVTSIIEDMRRLALQPMLPRTGNTTATGQAIDEAKAHSAVQSWAMGLKDALELAFSYTAMWMGEADTTEVFVHTDFGVSSSDAEALRTLVAARGSRDISLQTYWDELRRRNVLGPQFDPEEEQDRLDEEPPALGAMPLPATNVAGANAGDDVSAQAA